MDFLALHAAWPGRYPVLLESVARPGRYDLLLALPQRRLAQGPCSAGWETVERDFLTVFQRQWRAESATPSSTLPFTTGWFVYLGYELAADIEPRLRLPRPENLPTALAVRMGGALIRDRERGETWLVADTPELAREIQHDCAHPPPPPRVEFPAPTLWEDEEIPFLEAVRRARQYLHDGDIFQANLSRAWRAEGISVHHAPAIYHALRRANPAPFAGLCRFGDWAIVSSSPERLVTARDAIVQTRPIAGTRPRGDTPLADADLARTLLAHPKEQAEHVMLIDLLRNDLGKLCRPGTIQVDERMVLESYAHVHHIVSNIRGELRSGMLPGDILRALFPGGTITGCPKVRSMEIIAELENTPRGPYTGSFGYVDQRGWLDMNILIRTLWIEGDQLTFRAGAGIVHDSDPESELRETRAKAEGMARALRA